MAVLSRLLRRRWRGPTRIAAGFCVSALLIGVAGNVRLPRRPAPVREGPVVARGVVESQIVRGVGSPFDGVVESVAVRPGQAVRRGQLLFRMDPRPLRAMLGVAEEERSRARGALRQARESRAADLAAAEQQVAALTARLRDLEDRAGGTAPGTLLMLDDGQLIENYTDWEAVEELPAVRGALAEARSRRDEGVRSWEPVITAAAQEAWRAERQVSHFQGLLAQCARTSPIDGVATLVLARAGKWAPGRRPLVRVDDPAGYRVVTLVDASAKEGLEPGILLPLRRAEHTTTGQVQKLEPGVDRLAFHYWLWVKPARPEELVPGQRLSVTVSKPATRMAKDN